MNSNLFSKQYREITISGHDTVLVHSAKLNRTMVIFLHVGKGKKYPLNGICSKGSDIELIKSKITGKEFKGLISYISHDFDNGGDVIVSAKIGKEELDYALSVVEEQGELKLVIIPSLLLDRQLNNEDDRDNRKNFNYKVYSQFKEENKKEKNKKEVEPPEIYM